LQNRDYLLAQTGGEAYGHAPIGPLGALEYRLYAGTTLLDVQNQPGATYAVANLDTRYVVGGRLLWESPLEGLRLGGSVQALRLDGELVVDPRVTAPLQMAGELPADFAGSVNIRLPVVLWVTSLEYTWQGLVLAAEYSRWHSKLKSSVPVLYPNAKVTTEKLYGLASFTVAPWFTPGLYYAYDVRDVTTRKGRASAQHDTALTLRFDANEHWLLKLEGHYLHGTAWASSELNGGRPRDSLERDWFLFLFKTTLYF
jgi:hypothetical protein